MKVYSDNHYHIYNRGNNKDIIFFEDENYIYFLNQFKKYVAPFCNVYSYCLMPNHFHFFLRVDNEIAFEKGMKNFFISYSKAINKKYNRVGTLFQGRYKISEITTDNYYTTIVTYIHQNPVVAGLVKNLGDYRYSSYNAYLSPKESMLSRKEVLDWFGNLESFISCHQVIINEAEIGVKN